MTLPFPDAAEDGVQAAAIGTAEFDPGPSPEQQLADQDMRACIRGEIGKLSESLRTVLMLSALGGLADDDIAQTLGISHDAVKVRLHRARQALKKIIEARCDFYRNELSCKPASPDCCAPSRAPQAPVRDRAR
jgi:DNA-directed RNA polymerase specialized sigma24 family protein